MRRLVALCFFLLLLLVIAAAAAVNGQSTNFWRLWGIDALEDNEIALIATLKTPNALTDSTNLADGGACYDSASYVLGSYKSYFIYLSGTTQALYLCSKINCQSCTLWTNHYLGNQFYFSPLNMYLNWTSARAYRMPTVLSHVTYSSTSCSSSEMSSTVNYPARYSNYCFPDVTAKPETRSYKVSCSNNHSTGAQYEVFSGQSCAAGSLISRLQTDNSTKGPQNCFDGQQIFCFRAQPDKVVLIFSASTTFGSSSPGGGAGALSAPHTLAMTMMILILSIVTI